MKQVFLMYGVKLYCMFTGDVCTHLTITMYVFYFIHHRGKDLTIILHREESDNE